MRPGIWRVVVTAFGSLEAPSGNLSVGAFNLVVTNGSFNRNHSWLQVSGDAIDEPHMGDYVPAYFSPPLRKEKSMTAETNEHGLSRYIPFDVRRKIRQESFFGCVICGKLPYTYEHFDPPFETATTHNAAGMALLCGNCQLDTSSSRLSKERIANARAKPHNANHDPRWRTYLGPGSLSFVFAGNYVQAPGAKVVVNGETIIGFTQSEDGEVLLSGAFCDLEGRATMRFDDFEIVTFRESWDFEMTGTRFTVRSAHSTPVAIVEFNAQKNLISVERLRMSFAKDYLLDCTDKRFVFNCGQESKTVAGGNKVFSKSTVILLDINVPEIGKWEDWTRPR